jgi:hypothetical protein
MAQVVSGKKDFVLGPYRGVIITVTHSAVTTSTITKDDHGLSNIVFGSGNNETTEASGLIQINKNSGGAALGSVYTTSVQSGDVVTYLLIGN